MHGTFIIQSHGPASYFIEECSQMSFFELSGKKAVTARLLMDIFFRFPAYQSLFFLILNVVFMVVAMDGYATKTYWQV